MLELSRCLVKATTLGTLAVTIGCTAAIGQAAPPPPAVSVSPVSSRQVTETGDFIGRVVAIDKVDVAARVANCPLDNCVQPSEPDVPQ
ncbi:MAG: hypothetical protein WBB34_03690 [Xanthobacteraceae bacterium]